MIASIKAEIRKLLTVRSTYFILLLSLAAAVFFAFYVDGIKANKSALHDPGHLISETTSAIMFVGTLVSLVGVMLMTHEYRYNTILYTLASARRRTQVVIAKFLVVTVFAAIVALVFAVLAPVLAYLGVHAAGHTMVHQQAITAGLLGRAVFTGWGLSMLALILAMILRSQVGAIAAIFLVPGTVEGLIGLAIKHDKVYLPYSSVNAVLSHDPTAPISYGAASLVALIWIVGGGVIAWQLFLRRDAN